MHEVTFQQIPLADIQASGSNPRKTFEQTAMDELTASVLEKGVLQPILVRPTKKKGKFEIVAGERRFRAAKAVAVLHKDRDTIPATIREMDDAEALEIQITENLQRKDVHPLEEALGFFHLQQIKKMDVKEIAARVGKSPSYVAKRTKLTELIPEIQAVFFENRLTLTDAFEIATLMPEDQADLYKDDIEEETGTYELNRWTLNKYKHKLNLAAFDITDETLNKERGACTLCPFNSGSSSLLFPEEGDNPRCLNSRCFQDKTDTAYKRNLKSSIEDPATLIITNYYNSDEKDVKKLLKEGVEVLNHNHYDEFPQPEKPEREDFEDNNDTPEEDEREYQDELESYQRDLETWRNKVDSGAYLRAFIVTGSNKGKFTWVKLKKTTATNSATKKTATKDQPETTTKQQIEEAKAEIYRLETREKRAEELDAEKVWEIINTQIQPQTMASTGLLSQADRNLIAYLLYDGLASSDQDKYRKAKGIKLNSSTFYNSLPRAEAMFTNISDEDLNYLIRFYCLAKAGGNSYNTSHLKNGLQALTYRALMVTHPKILQEAEAAQKEIADKRKDRVKGRIEKLKFQIKKLKMNEKLGDIKSAKGKGSAKAPGLADVLTTKQKPAKKGKGLAALLTDAKKEA